MTCKKFYVTVAALCLLPISAFATPKATPSVAAEDIVPNAVR